MLRPARREDREFILRVRNEKSVRRVSFQSARISASEHAAWFSRTLKDPNTRLYLIRRGSCPAGTLRINQIGVGRVEVHLALLPEWRGKGIATEALSELSREKVLVDWKVKTILARIKTGNTASRLLFAKAGYVYAGKKSGALCYTKDLRRRALLVMVDAGPNFGMGHLMRQAALAAEFQQSGWEVLFYLRNGELPSAAQQKILFSQPLPRTISEQELSSISPAAVIVDTMTLPARKRVKQLIANGAVIALVGNYPKVPRWADLCINPYTPSKPEAVGTKILSHPRFTVLSDEFKHAASQMRQKAKLEKNPSLFILPGGGDTGGMIFLILKALARLPEHYRFHMVVGAYFTGKKRLSDEIRKYRIKGLCIYEGRTPSQIAELMRRSRLALLSYGRSMDESRFAGLPAILLSSNPLNRLGSLAAERLGGVVYAGDITVLSAGDLAQRIQALMEDERSLTRMRRRSLRLVDEEGAARICREIVRRVQ